MLVFFLSFFIVEIVVVVNWVVFLESEFGIYLLKLLMIIFLLIYMVKRKNKLGRCFFRKICNVKYF